MKHKKALALSFSIIMIASWAVAQDLEKLEIALPKAQFEGTPRDLKVGNVNPVAEKDRPPLMVPRGTFNLAQGKPVTASDDEPIIGELEMVTDGDKEAADGSFVEFGPGIQWVQVDLGQESEISAVVLWHYHKEARIYKDVVIQVSNDPDFVSDVQTIFSNDHDNSAGFGLGQSKQEYIEDRFGKLADAKGVKARYVRLYSNGNTSGGSNHYIEVEVYGRPVS